MTAIVRQRSARHQRCACPDSFRPAAIRLRIKDGTISAVRVSGRWRVHTASISALLGEPPASAPAAAQTSTAASPQTTPTAADSDAPVFGPDDALHIAQCEMMRYSYIPEHVRLANWILAKYKRFGGAAAARPNSSVPPDFDPNKAFARPF